MKLNRCIALIVALTCGLLAPAGAQSLPPAGPDGLAFVGNRGQWPAGVRSSVRAGVLNAWFERDGWTIALPDPGASGQDEPGARIAVAALRLRFVGADPDAPWLPRERLPGWHNDLRSQDPARWALSVPRYASQRWSQPYPGIDVVTRGDGGALRYDLMLGPGADLSQVVVATEGALGLSLDEHGSLRIETELGPLLQAAPITWQVFPDGHSEPLECAFRLLGEGRFGFDAPGADPSLPMVVDPTLVWASYLGGDSIDYVFDSALDASGRVLLAGFTHSLDYPTTLGSYDVSLGGTRDAFVTCLAADGESLVFSTLLGGSGSDEARAIDVAADGSVLVGGLTSSSNFPVFGATFGTSFSGGGALLGSDGFVSLLDASGALLLASGYVGGSADDYVIAVDMGDDGRAHFVGLTQSADLPVTPGAYDTTFGGGSTRDGFVGRLGAGGATLESLTYLGGSSNDVLNDVLVEPDGRVSVVGWTSSADFPVTAGAAQASFGGFSDAVIATFDAGGSVLEYSTFLGGSSNEDCLALDLTADGRLVLGGTTRSTDFPVSAKATDSTQGGGSIYGDGYLAVLSADGSQFDFATYLGGSADDAVNDVKAIDGGLVVVLAQSASTDLELTADALDSTLGGSLDVVLASYDPDAGALLYSSYVGGAAADRAFGLCMDGGEAILAGYTNSDDLPVTPNAYDVHFDGTSTWITDGWIMRVDLGLSQILAGAFADLGFATAGSSGFPTLDVSGSLEPAVGGSMQLNNGLAYSTGLLLVGVSAGYQPTHGGVCVPCPVLVNLPFRVGGDGAAQFAFMNHGSLPSGLTLYAQAWVLDNAGPVGWSSSNAVQGIVP